MSIERNIGIDLAQRGQYEEALVFLSKAYQSGDYKALNDAGVVFERNNEFKKAMYFYKEAFKNGVSVAAQNIGNMYEQGYGVKRNSKKAIVYYQKAIDMGCGSSYYKLSNLYLHGIGVNKNEAKAFELVKQGAEIEDDGVNCLVSLGYYYECGIGTNIDLKQAFICYKKSAKSGSSGVALYNLGLCYLYGKGTRKNSIKAIEQLVKATNVGYADAFLRMYYIYKQGEIRKKDLDLAAFWLKGAIRHDCLAAHLHLAEDNLTGDNITHKIDTNFATKAISRFVDKATVEDEEE